MQIGLIRMISTQKALKTYNKWGSKLHVLGTNQYCGMGPSGHFYLGMGLAIRDV